MAVENINNMTEGLAPADRSDVKDKNFKMPKAPGDKYIKSAINLLSKRTPLGIGITAAKSALPYVDDAVKFIKRKDPFGLFKIVKCWVCPVLAHCLDWLHFCLS